MPYLGHGVTGFLLAAFHLPQEVELDIEELLELQSLACRLHVAGVGREMYVEQCIRQVHQVVTLEHIAAEGILHTLF